MCDTRLGDLLAATTSSPASLDVRVADLLVVFHFGAAVGFAAAGRFATASWFATTSISNTASGFATTSCITTRVTAGAMTVTKAEALGAEAERKNDRPENDVPFHRFLINPIGQPARKALYSLSDSSLRTLLENISSSPCTHCSLPSVCEEHTFQSIWQTGSCWKCGSVREATAVSIRGTAFLPGDPDLAAVGCVTIVRSPSPWRSSRWQWLKCGGTTKTRDSSLFCTALSVNPCARHC